MSNNTKRNVILGTAVVAAAGILIAKKGAELSAAELEEVAKAMKDIETDEIGSKFFYGTKESQEVSIAQNSAGGSSSPTYTVGAHTGLSRESVSATLITDKDGNVIGWYYKVEGNTGDQYNVFYDGKYHENVSAEITEKGKIFKKGENEIFTDDLSGNITAKGRFKGTSTPGPTDGTTNLDIYKNGTNEVIGHVDTTNGKGWFKNIGYGTQRDDLEALKSQYLSLINKKVNEGSLDPDMGEKLKKAIENIDTSSKSIRTIQEFNEAAQSKLDYVEKSTSFKKGYEEICRQFDNSALVKEINEFAGQDIVTSKSITTLAIVGGIAAVGLALLKNQNKMKKVVVSLASSFPDRTNNNSRSRS